MKPKSESRNPRSDRNPNPEIRISGWVSDKIVSTRSRLVKSGFAHGFTPPFWNRERRLSEFKFRASFGIREFGIRIFPPRL
jgi:hypothetical protein